MSVYIEDTYYNFVRELWTFDPTPLLPPPPPAHAADKFKQFKDLNVRALAHPRLSASGPMSPAVCGWGRGWEWVSRSRPWLRGGKGLASDLGVMSGGKGVGVTQIVSTYVMRNPITWITTSSLSTLRLACFLRVFHYENAWNTIPDTLLA